LSNYTKATNFASKDSLLTGNPLKIVKGTEIDNEFNAISTAVNTKFDSTSIASPGPIGATTPSTISATNVQMTSANGGQLAGLRNKIINGDMRVAQRGTSGLSSGISTNTLTLDRMAVFANGAAVTVSQVTGVNFGSTVSSVLNVAGAASNTTVNVGQRIESKNVRDLAGNSATVSFWLYQTTGSTQTITTTIYAPTATDNWTGQTTITTFTNSVPTATWTYCTGTVSITSVAQYGLAVSVGGIAVVAGQSLAIGNWQLEVGPVATPFEQRPIGMELELCQRYYYEFGTFHIGMYGTTNAQGDQAYPVLMRTSTPSFTFTDASGTAGQVTIYNGANTNTTLAVGSFTAGANRLIMDANTTASGTTTWLRAYNCKISAEL